MKNVPTSGARPVRSAGSLRAYPVASPAAGRKEKCVRKSGRTAGRSRARKNPPAQSGRPAGRQRGGPAHGRGRKINGRHVETCRIECRDLVARSTARNQDAAAIPLVPRQELLSATGTPCRSHGISPAIVARRPKFRLRTVGDFGHARGTCGLTAKSPKDAKNLLLS